MARRPIQSQSSSSLREFQKKKTSILENKQQLENKPKSILKRKRPIERNEGHDTTKAIKASAILHENQKSHDGVLKKRNQTKHEEANAPGRNATTDVKQLTKKQMPLSFSSLPKHSHLDTQQLIKAIHALKAYLQKKRAQMDAESGRKELLIDDEDEGEHTLHSFQLNVVVKKIPDHKRNKPFRIPLRHSLTRGEVCLITKDPASEYEKLKDKMPGRLHKVLGIRHLKKEFSRYQDRRDLCKSYDLFLADDRVLPLLPGLLGKIFYGRKRQPVPVVLSGKNIEREIIQALNSTYIWPSTGSQITVKVARTSFTPVQVFENILQSIDTIVGYIPKKWNNIQAIYLKTDDSVALPVYNSAPESPRAAVVSETN